jgi:hypothetical protein
MKIIIAFFTLLAGCAHFGPPPPCNVAEADDTMVQGCRFVGTVEGRSGFLGPDGAYDSAKTDARLRAQDIGATHVVIAAAGAGPYHVQRVYGRAYQCPPR